MTKKITVLIVEDEILPAVHIQMEINKLGYCSLKPVYRGEDAIKVAEQEKPEVILMDIRLAGEIDGIEAAQKILSLYQPSIIFMTGYLHDEIIERVNKLNHAGYFLKPIHISKIHQVIESIYNNDIKTR